MGAASGGLPPDAESLLKALPLFIRQNGQKEPGHPHQVLLGVTLPGSLPVNQGSRQCLVYQHPLQSKGSKGTAFAASEALLSQPVGNGLVSQVLLNSLYNYVFYLENGAGPV